MDKPSEAKPAPQVRFSVTGCTIVRAFTDKVSFLSCDAFDEAVHGSYAEYWRGSGPQIETICGQGVKLARIAGWEGAITIVEIAPGRLGQSTVVPANSTLAENPGCQGSRSESK